MQGKKTFSSFSSKVKSAGQTELASQEAKTIVGMHKFEVVELAGQGASHSPQVLVTMINQVDLMNDDDNYEVYTGMHKSMAITALKKNMAKFHQSWIEFLQRKIKVVK